MPESVENQHVTISTVTPVYSGQDFLVALVDKINEVKLKWEQENAPMRIVESVFIDDASIDNSRSILRQLADQYNWIRILPLSKNFGTHSATAAGIIHSKGNWIVTLDEDLQHPPTHIEEMLRTAVTHSADIVYAQPVSAVHGGSWRDFSSIAMKSLISKVSSTPQIKLFNSFRLLRGDLARAAAANCTTQTYFDMALTWFSSSVKTVPIELKDSRFIKNKSSGFNLKKLAGHAKKMAISSRTGIASKGLYFGALTAVLATFAGMAVIIQHYFFPEEIKSEGWASLIVLISFFSGAIVTILCLALEYLNILLQKQMGQPNFYILSREQDKVLIDWFNR